MFKELKYDNQSLVKYFLKKGREYADSYYVDGNPEHDRLARQAYSWAEQLILQDIIKDEELV